MGLVTYLYKGYCLKCQGYVPFEKPKEIKRKEIWMECPSCHSIQLLRVFLIRVEKKGGK